MTRKILSRERSFSPQQPTADTRTPSPATNTLKSVSPPPVPPSQSPAMSQDPIQKYASSIEQTPDLNFLSNETGANTGKLIQNISERFRVTQELLRQSIGSSSSVAQR